MSNRVLVVGGIGVDVNTALYDGHWPLPADADVVFASVGDPSVGHAGAGVAFQANALGWGVVLADVIGDDGFGRFVSARCADLGVQLDADVHPSGTRRSVNLVRPGGRRLSLYDPRHPYEYSPDPALWRRHFADVSWVHAVVVNWARGALRDAVEAGIVTSTDVQDWDHHNPHHREFAMLADYVFCSGTNLSDPDALVRDVFANGRAKLVVVTHGALGAMAYPRDGAPQRLPIVDVGREIVDTNGAGDAFCATFMSATLRGASIRQAGREAAIAGAWTSASHGTNENLVTPGDIAAFVTR